MPPPVFYPVGAAAGSPGMLNMSLASLGLGWWGVKQFEHTDRKVLQTAPEPDLHLVTNM